MTASPSLSSLAIQFAKNSPINTRSNLNNNTNTVFVLSTSAVASPTTTTAVTSDISNLFPQDLLSLSVQTLPMTISLPTSNNPTIANTAGGAIITELPLEQPEIVTTNNIAHHPDVTAVQDEIDSGSIDSRGGLIHANNRIHTPETASGASTLTKRAPKHSEVYVWGILVLS